MAIFLTIITKANHSKTPQKIIFNSFGSAFQAFVISAKTFYSSFDIERMNPKLWSHLGKWIYNDFWILKKFIKNIISLGNKMLKRAIRTPDGKLLTALNCIQQFLITLTVISVSFFTVTCSSYFLLLLLCWLSTRIK